MHAGTSFEKGTRVVIDAMGMTFVSDGKAQQTGDERYGPTAMSVIKVPVTPF